MPDVLLIVLGAFLATGGGVLVELWRERREGKAAGRVIYRELMHNRQALSTFRKTEGEWLSEPTNAAWLAYGSTLSRILDNENWRHVASGYSIMGYWRGLSHEEDAADIPDQTAADIGEAMVALCNFVGL